MTDLAYTLGEPAGIGPDIIVQLAQSQSLADVVCIGDADLLKRRADLMNLPLTVREPGATRVGKSELKVLHQPLVNNKVCGAPLTDNVAALLSGLDTAIEGCLSGDYAAMVTGPLHKGIVNEAGISFSGHTEYLAEKTNAPQPVMLLATNSLRVALITTHLPLRDVSDAITKDRIHEVCRVIHRDFEARFKILQPRLLVCGLNPHAGEGGHLGREEIEVITPALEELRAEGLNIVGPLPADTLFTPKYVEQADVVVAMYHDQGLPVLKSVGFGEAANITLGLPIIRTSVDHGTAFDLAGSGRADTGGLATAFQVARQMTR